MNDVDVEQIRKRVQKRLRIRQEFYVHAAVYVAVNILVWFIYAVIPGAHGGTPWPLFVTFGWGIGLVSHAADTYFKTSERLSRHEDDAVQREIERERARLYGDAALEKPKRGPAHLTDDGEIEYDEEAEAEAALRRSRSRR